MFGFIGCNGVLSGVSRVFPCFFPIVCFSFSGDVLFWAFLKRLFGIMFCFSRFLEHCFSSSGFEMSCSTAFNFLANKNGG